MPEIVSAFPLPVECNTLVFRALRKGWLNQASQAYILRRFEDGTLETGISVGNNVENGVGTLTKIPQVDSLLTGYIRDIGLDVHPDYEGAVHAEIRPLPEPEDRLNAERWATQLIQIARIAWPESEISE